MALQSKKPIKICSFFCSLLIIITDSLSSPLPRLPDVWYSSEFPNLSGTYGGTGAGIPLGWWQLLQKSIGISAMHMQLLYDDKIIVFDRTDFGNSNLSLAAGKQCIRRQQDAGDFFDCTAHSVLYDVASNTFRPLTVLTDTFCSSGSVDSSGNLIQTGGYNVGERVIRTFTPCSSATSNTCDWAEMANSLAARRWYASNAVLPDGRIIVVGGRGAHTYEFHPKNKRFETFFKLPFLAETWDGRNRENNLYPFLHLLPNGNLFIFANNRSIEFDYVAGKVVREFPIMPSPERRNYPSTGSSVLLPVVLNGSSTNSPEIEVLICGGASLESFDLADSKGVYVAAARTCGRMKITAPQPQWIMEVMPMPRVMPDMVMLPTGDVLIINGAANGTAGWENADNPVLHPVLYRTSEPDPTRKFVTLNPTHIPRMYHSCAVLVADGRVIVGGSNPHPNYNFSREAKYPTELSLEAFYLPYLDPVYSELRPSILSVETESKVVMYGQTFSVTYALGREKGTVAVTMVLPPFTTHSFGMNQRLVVLGEPRVERLSVFGYKVTATAPPNERVAPPGFRVDVPLYIN
ncbi:hypothetical protein Cgig2_024817 [Carnegiea gigantea]|uniref:Galactose oxidase n=1 Tax=Carnegiea gigantea TaxID=171969 RepID=A0A9Q1KD36_9CARY|nr:hypothetical protein Cgig2_024817 [Carnegiea gigantea]